MPRARRPRFPNAQFLNNLLFELSETECYVSRTHLIPNWEKEELFIDIDRIYLTVVKVMRSARATLLDESNPNRFSTVDRLIIQILFPVFFKMRKRIGRIPAVFLDNMDCKRMIAKVDNAEEYLSIIQQNIFPLDLDIQVNYMTNINKKTVLFSFPTMEDLYRYKIELLNTICFGNIIEEKNKDVLVLIYNIQNFTENDLQSSIYQVSRELVDVLTLGKMKNGGRGALIKISGSSLFKLQILDENILYVQEQSCNYRLAPNGFQFLEYEKVYSAEPNVNIVQLDVKETDADIEIMVRNNNKYPVLESKTIYL